MASRLKPFGIARCAIQRQAMSLVLCHLRRPPTWMWPFGCNKGVRKLEETSRDAERADACRRIAAAIERNSEELAKLLTLEQGKPLDGLGSRFEIGGAVAWTRHTAEIELPVEVLQDSPEGRVELHRKPIGVVGSITPWNWPVMIACWHIIPAVRTGNTVIIKPSPNTPLSTIRLVELINEVLPTGRRQRDYRTTTISGP